MAANTNVMTAATTGPASADPPPAAASFRALGPGDQVDEHGGGVAVDHQGLPVGNQPDLLRAQRGAFGGGDRAAGGVVGRVEGGGDLGDVGVADERGEPV